MPFKMTVSNGKSEWEEKYPDHARRWDVTNQAQAQMVAEAIVDRFNATLRDGEKPRKLVKVEFIEDDGTIDDM